MNLKYSGDNTLAFTFLSFDGEFCSITLCCYKLKCTKCVWIKNVLFEKNSLRRKRIIIIHNVTYPDHAAASPRKQTATNATTATTHRCIAGKIGEKTAIHSRCNWTLCICRKFCHLKINWNACALSFDRCPLLTEEFIPVKVGN